MPALAGIEKIAGGVARKTHPRVEEIGDRFPGIAQHTPHRFGVVLVMPRAHGVLKISFVIPVPFEYADAALREIGIAVTGAFLG